MMMPILILISFLLLFAGRPVSSKSGPQHIFLLAGQSNMVGHGGVDQGGDGLYHWDGKVPSDCKPNPNIFHYSTDKTWSEAKEPIHAETYQNAAGIGPAMPFSRHVLEVHPSYGTIGLVPCAKDWTRISEWMLGTTLYDNMIEKARAAVGAGGRIEALLWWQGGTDANHQDEAVKYKDRLEQFFEDVLTDLGTDDFHIVMIIIPPGRANFTDVIRKAQLSIQLPDVIPFDPPEVPLQKDGVHVSSDGQVTLGKKLADHYCSIVHC